MAFNTQTFITRLGSAIIFSAIMMCGLLLNEWAFIGLFFVINMLCLHEYSKIVSSILQTRFTRNEKVNFMVLGITAFIVVASIPINFCQNHVAVLLHQFFFYFLGLFIGVLIIFILFKKSNKTLYLLSGLGYISAALGFLIQLRFQSIELPIILILLIWMNDSLAYLTGSFIGKTKFFPSISPKKTLEGTLGGIFFTLMFALIWGYFTQWFPMSVWIIFSLIAGIIGTIGDLVESKLKRLANIKDSGSLMPGHGGALDRFDSLLLSAPIAFLVAMIFELCR